MSGCKDFDWTAMFIGLFVGMLLLIIIVWILYANRWWIFDNCAVSSNICTASEYYSDPGEALSQTSVTDSEILHVNSDGDLEYKRVPKESNCYPGSDQTVEISYPQYCRFELSDGTYTDAKSNLDTVSNKEVIYVGADGKSVITARSNCKPVKGAKSGVPLPKWDPN